MISINIAFDDQDTGLGSYFQECKQDLIDFLEDRRINDGDEYTIDEIHTTRCNEVYIDHRISSINANNFLFIAYSHGDADCLTAGGEAYVHLDKNTHLFNNSFFYAVACLTGARLGQNLVDSGCHVFIGYKDPFYVLNGKLQLSVNCANIGIKMFLSGKSAEEAFRLIESYYNQEIDRLVFFSDIMAASVLAGNKNALVLVGRNDLTIEDFKVELSN
jgi:hypothetical protein